MSLLGDIFGGIGSIFGLGGGNNSNNNNLLSALSPLLAGQLTAQRIPGQTQAGAYTPDGSTVGATYNYIPTGATQIDPQLIQQILSGGNFSNNYMNAGSFAGPNTGNANALNNILLGNINNFANPTSDAGMRLRAGADQAWTQGVNSGNMSSNWAGWLSDLAASNDLAYRGLGETIRNNPFIQQGIQRGGDVGNAMYGAGQGIAGQGANLGDLYTGYADKALSNPFAAQAQTGAGQAGGMYQQAGQNAFGQGNMLAGTAMQGLPAASAVLNTAFDPQQALYDRTLRQTQDQLGTYLANSGLTNSGAGAKIASDAFNNFNIDWQNNQLGRQTQGLSAFNQGVGGTGNNLSGAQNMQQQGAGSFYTGSTLPYSTAQGISSDQLGVLSQLGQGLSTGARLQNTGLGMQGQGATFGSDTYNAMHQPQLSFQNAYSSVGLPGTINAAAGMVNQGNNAMQSYLNAGQAPYGALSTIYGTQGNALGNYNVNTGNNLGTLGNYYSSGSNLNNTSVLQGLNYLTSVMNGARNAADATRSVAGTTTTQNAAAAGALSPLINSGLGALGNLFSGGGTIPNTFGNIGAYTNSQLAGLGYL